MFPGYRAYSAEAALRLTLFSNFTYTHEVILDASQKNLRIVEVPLKVRGEREFGRSRVARNVISYGFQWLAIFLRTVRDIHPFQVFGVFSFAVFGFSAAAGVFVFVHWLATGQTYPYRSLVTLSAMGILTAVFFFTVALLSDMLKRQREISNEILYLLRRARFDQAKERNAK